MTRLEQPLEHDAPPTIVQWPSVLMVAWQQALGVRIFARHVVGRSLTACRQQGCNAPCLAFFREMATSAWDGRNAVLFRKGMRR